MTVEIKSTQEKHDQEIKNLSDFNDKVFTKDYVDFLNEAGWKLENKLPSNINQYSDLLEDTDWKSNYSDLNSLKHYRRDLDALS